VTLSFPPAGAGTPKTRPIFFNRPQNGALFDSMNIWKNVAEHLNMGVKTLRLIVKFYKDLGYEF
jgi:hypothetical protein